MRDADAILTVQVQRSLRERFSEGRCVGSLSPPRRMLGVWHKSLVSRTLAGSTRPSVACPASSCTPERWHRASVDDLIRPQQQRLRDGEPERLGGLEVDDQFKLSRLQDRQLTGFRTPENLARICSYLLIDRRKHRSVRHQATPPVV